MEKHLVDEWLPLNWSTICPRGDHVKTSRFYMKNITRLPLNGSSKLEPIWRYLLVRPSSITFITYYTHFLLCVDKSSLMSCMSIMESLLWSLPPFEVLKYSSGVVRSLWMYPTPRSVGNFINWCPPVKITPKRSCDGFFNTPSYEVDESIAEKWIVCVTFFSYTPKVSGRDNIPATTTSPPANCVIILVWWQNLSHSNPILDKVPQNKISCKLFLSTGSLLTTNWVSKLGDYHHCTQEWYQALSHVFFRSCIRFHTTPSR